MRINSIFWMVPFISFMIGYFIVQSSCGKTTTTVPALVGKELHEAVFLLSERALVPRIIADKECSHLPKGTILQQKPEPHAKIRAHQAVLLVVSRLPAPLMMPHIVGSAIEQGVAQLVSIGLQPRVYEVESAGQMQGVCIAQWPSAQTELKQGNAVILYCVKDKKKPYIVPLFKGKTFELVKEICEKYGIICQVIHTMPIDIDHQCAHCRVVNQRPLPGTLLTLDATKKIAFQFQV